MIYILYVCICSTKLNLPQFVGVLVEMDKKGNTKILSLLSLVPHATSVHLHMDFKYGIHVDIKFGNVNVKSENFLQLRLSRSVSVL